MADEGTLLAQLDAGDRRTLVRYWFVGPPGSRGEVLRRILEHPELWSRRDVVPLIAQVGSRTPECWPELASAVAEALKRRVCPVEELASTCPAVVRTAPDPERAFQQRRDLAQTFAELAGPGEAKHAVQMLLSAGSETDSEGFASWADPLLTWMLERGGAEMRRTTDPQIAFVLRRALVAATSRMPSLLSSLLRLVACSEAPPNVLIEGGDGERAFWPACERALSTGAEDYIVSEAVVAVLPGVRAIGAERFLVPLQGDTRLRRVVLETFATKVQETGPLAEYLWSEVLRFAPAQSIRFSDAGLRSAMKALQAHGSCPLPHTEAWAEVVAYACLNRSENSPIDLTPLPGAWSLDTLAQEASLAPGICRALTRILKESPPQLHPMARECMRESDTNPRIASLALLCLSPSKPRDSAQGEVPADIVEALTAIATRDWERQPYGQLLATTFLGVTEVEIGNPHEPDVLIDLQAIGPERTAMVTGTQEVYAKLVAQAPTHRDGIAACALYFVHEVVHVHQGLRAKKTVTNLRAIGSEHSVLHFDLEADHVAASAVAEAMPDYDLRRLKALQVRGTEVFPPDTYHTSSSVFRKSLRVVSLMADILLRTRGERFGITAAQEGYASVDLPIHKGPVVITWSTRTRCVIAEAEATAHQANVLARAANDMTFESLEEIVSELLDAAKPTYRLAGSIG